MVFWFGVNPATKRIKRKATHHLVKEKVNKSKALVLCALFT
jgi:hypothetical protein